MSAEGFLAGFAVIAFCMVLLGFLGLGFMELLKMFTGYDLDSEPETPRLFISYRRDICFLRVHTSCPGLALGEVQDTYQVNDLIYYRENNRWWQRKLVVTGDVVSVGEPELRRFKALEEISDDL